MTSIAARITAQVRTALRKTSECDGRCRGRYGCEPAGHLQEPLESRCSEAVRRAYGVEIAGRHAEVFEYRDRSIGVFADDGRAVAHAWTVTRAADQCVARQALGHDLAQRGHHGGEGESR